MRMVNIIEKKRDCKELTKEEINFVIENYTNKAIPDYQMSALLMAIVLNGMTQAETANLTQAMVNSGEIVDLSSIVGLKVDKHSTGGVGDKTSLVLGPLIASVGVPFAKMSGRGLGHTGGTLDKLESIPGFNISLTEEEFIKQVNDEKIAIIGQTASLAPADKSIYALRDVTGTVPSIGLMASSIMSKKIAAGTDTILLDVKYGDGAFMPTVEAAVELATAMISIGTNLGKDTKAIVSSMDQPLGNAIGNSLEVKEAIATLSGHGPSDLVDLCTRAGGIMLKQAKRVATVEEGIVLLKENITNGKALDRLVAMVKAQGGNEKYITNPELFTMAKEIIAVNSITSGYVATMHTLDLGVLAMELGAGRRTKEDDIDMAVGFVMQKKTGDRVEIGDILVEIHTNTGLSDVMRQRIIDTFVISQDKPLPRDIIAKVVE